MASERSYTPPLVDNVVVAEKRLSLEDQVKYLVDEINNLKQNQAHKVNDDKCSYTWENIPLFDPDNKNITANKWLRLYEQKAYFCRWDDVTLMINVTNNLTGRTREWFISSSFSGISFTEFKQRFREIYDIEPQTIGNIFKNAATFRSVDADNLLDYFDKKLTLLNKLSWNIAECDKLNIIISGILDPLIRQLEYSNN